MSRVMIHSNSLAIVDSSFESHKHTLKRLSLAYSTVYYNAVEHPIALVFSAGQYFFHIVRPVTVKWNVEKSVCSHFGNIGCQLPSHSDTVKGKYGT